MTSNAILKTENKLTLKQAAAVTAGVILMLLSGLVNGWSIFVEPIEKELHLLRQDTSLIFTISLSVSIGGQILSGFLSKRIKTRWVYFLAAVFAIVGFTGASNATGLMQIYIYYGVFVGLTIGMLYNLVLTNVIAMFQRNISLISGILLMGFGMGTLVLGSIATALIKLFGWRSTFAILAVVYSTLLIAASFVITPARKSAPDTKKVPSVQPTAMLRKRSFHCFFGWCIVISSCNLIVIGHSSLISRDIGASFVLASFLTGMASMSSGISRVIFGHFSDKFGISRLEAVLTAGAAISALAIIAGYVLNNVPLLALGYLFAGALNGGEAVYICSFVQQRYGMENYGINMAFTNIYMIFGSVFGTALAGAIKTQTGSYLPSFLLMLLYATLGAAFAFLLKRTEKRTEKAYGKTT
ncbi:MAG: MFS transporter [Hydrogenoanaerobacterium sp.]